MSFVFSRSYKYYYGLSSFLPFFLPHLLFAGAQYDLNACDNRQQIALETLLAATNVEKGNNVVRNIDLTTKRRPSNRLFVLGERVFVTRI